jgi:hypothetical protein
MDLQIILYVLWSLNSVLSIYNAYVAIKKRKGNVG